GIRATAEYRHRLCTAISSPSSSCQRPLPAGSRQDWRCTSSRVASTRKVSPERNRMASMTPAPLSKASRAAMWLEAKMQARQARISTARGRLNGRTDKDIPETREKRQGREGCAEYACPGRLRRGIRDYSPYPGWQIGGDDRAGCAERP